MTEEANNQVSNETTADLELHSTRQLPATRQLMDHSRAQLVRQRFVCLQQNRQRPDISTFDP